MKSFAYKMRLFKLFRLFLENKPKNDYPLTHLVAWLVGKISFPQAFPQVRPSEILISAISKE